MARPYQHLSAEERAVIQIARSNGSTLRSIARLLGRNVSTVSRELARNEGQVATDVRVRYDAKTAGMAYRMRRARSVRPCKLLEGGWLHEHVRNRLIFDRWSPQQIAARLRTMHPNDPARQVSHETIYAAIYTHPRGSLKKAMVEALRQEKPRRGRRRTTAATGRFVPEALRIVHRPETIAERKLPGHWEGDLIKGAFNRSCVGTLVERKTRFVVLCRMDGCTARDALEGFTRQMKKLPAFLRESLTYDRGSELACHANCPSA